VRPNVRENRQMRPSNAVRTVWNGGAIGTSHPGFRPIQKIATIDASSAFIRGMPNDVIDTAGRSPAQARTTCGAQAREDFQCSAHL